MVNQKNHIVPKEHAGGAPSAPPVLQEERQTMNNDPSASRGREPSQGGGSGFIQVSLPAQDSIPFDSPPPSYQMAMNCPTTPYPSGDIPPAAARAGYAGYPPKPLPVCPAQHSQPPIRHTNHAVGIPQGPPPQGVPPTQVVVAVGNGFLCPHCNVGVITKETDMCCMLCLILLTIFTFPIGLIFLCCLPCTISRRCSNCRRSA